MPTPAIQLCAITKRFGSLVANKNIDFAVGKGQIHALLGENGAGKTTLMRILYGLYHADEGEIWMDGQKAEIRSPKDAIRLGIGMVTQHFALAAPLTVTENIVLGYQKGVALNLAQAAQQVAHAAEKYGIDVDPMARVADLSVGERQRVEILKALFRNVQVLILDEPTAVLAPQEADRLFETLRGLQTQGLSVIFISHKLYEVMAITDQITVLRSGEVAGSVTTAETTQSTLAQMMVGRAIQAPSREGRVQPVADALQQPLLQMDQLSVHGANGLPAVRNVSLSIAAGEVVGLAGVSGNGQAELAKVLDGTHGASGGQILLDGQEITHLDPVGKMKAGMGRIPEERHESVVGEMTVAQNIALENLDDFASSGTFGGTLNRKRMATYAQQLINTYQIKAEPHDRIRTLSGGNMQKVLLARVLERNPKAIVVSQPTRGLDIGATEYVRGKLLEQRARGAAILLISEDLDEILELSDRIAVIYEGKITGIVGGDGADKEEIGLMMSGVTINAL
ncbi:MAG: ABC transporter ATP-binding protein [Chloroflexota bacterium]